MKTGRPAKPTAVRELQGNPGKRPLNKREPKFTPLREAPPCPDFLGEIGRQTWEHYADQLVTSRVMTAADVHILVAFCDAWERWHECATDVRENGSSLDGEKGRVRNPASVALTDAWRVVKECSALLGLDPSSRSRLVVDKGETETNPFALLTGGKK